MDSWYFAYGSNLLAEQMVARTGPLRSTDGPPQIARLSNYRLAFNMRGGDGQVYANIVSPGDGVLGVLYRCTPAALKKLDGYERGYERRRIVVIDEQNAEFEAVAYVARPERRTSEGRPSPAYLNKIVTGARAHGLPEEYIRELERET